MDRDMNKKVVNDRKFATQTAAQVSNTAIHAYTPHAVI